MSSTPESIFNLTVPVVLSHPHLLEAVKFKGKNGKETGEPKYSGSFVFPQDNPDLSGLKALALSVAKAKWPGRDVVADAKAREFAFPFSNGDVLIQKRIKALKDKNKEYTGDADFQKGATILKSSSKFQPRLSIVENGKVIDLTDETIKVHKNKFYFGVFALAQFNFVGYDGVGQNPDGVTAYLNMVLSLNRGEKLTSGGPSAAEVFAGYAGNLSAEDPTTGLPAGDDLNDDIPF